MMHILIVDDDARIRNALTDLLSEEGYAVESCGSGEEALSRSDLNTWDVFLFDVMLPGMDGLELLETIRQQAARSTVLMMSGHSRIATAIQATRLGAHNFFEKPINPEKLLLELRHLSEQMDLKRQVASLQKRVSSLDELIGESKPMRRLKALIAKAAPSEGRVLISGENGTGKELVARAIHAGSSRNEKPFLSLNCAAIPKELVESELFGHEKGAFTGAVAKKSGKFENAHSGILFLDEIGDMSLDVQAKLLRVLQENEAVRVGGNSPYAFDVRVIAATNKNLQKEIAQGRFRDDLFYRLNVIPIQVAPLRERKADIPLLAGYFLQWFGERTGKARKQFDRDAMHLLRSYAWPGNVRELKNFIERLIILHEGETIIQSDVQDLLPKQDILLPDSRHSKKANQSFRDQVQQFENELLLRVHQETNGNISEMARRLRMDRSNLHRKLRQYGIQ